jgi:hypothetical protein
MITLRLARQAGPTLPALPLAIPAALSLASAASSGQAGPGVGNVPQGTQSNASYAASFRDA